MDFFLNLKIMVEEEFEFYHGKDKIKIKKGRGGLGNRVLEYFIFINGLKLSRGKDLWETQYRLAKRYGLTNYLE